VTAQRTPSEGNSNQNILETGQEYVVAVEKLEVPINNQFMPINTTKEPFRFAIFNDSKSEIIPDLPFGLTEFQIKCRFTQLKNF
jgi:uncharacterized UPF0160 family protein